VLNLYDVKTVVDVRLRPDRASRGIFSKAKTSSKGIEAWLREAGIEYLSFVELGNIFADMDDWKDRYQQLLARAGDLLTERLRRVPEPFCLLCAENDPDRCHRGLIAEYLVKTGFCSVVHIQ